MSSIKDITETVFSGHRVYSFVTMVVVWAGIQVVFWRWWFTPIDKGDPYLYWSLTFIIFMMNTSMALMTLSRCVRMRHVKLDLPPPEGKNVIMATSFVPGSEPVEILEKTLKGMLAQKYPHDIWVCDEGGNEQESAKVRKLVASFNKDLSEKYAIKEHACCYFADHANRGEVPEGYFDLQDAPINIRYFCRFGIPQYQQDSGKFQKKTKYGNYNSLLDFVEKNASKDFDILIQMDTDHVPVEGYLERMISPFSCEEVAYAAASSIPWRGIEKNWHNRGRLEQSTLVESMFLMRDTCYGYPMIEGSHVGYNIKKLKDIGGYATTRAEDIAHTYAFCAKDQEENGGYKGVYVHNAIALGESTPSFEVSMKQEMAWSESVGRLFVEKYFNYAKKMSFFHKIRTFSLALYYVVSTVPYLFLTAIPFVMVLFGVSGPSISYQAFFSYYAVLLFSCMFPVLWVKFSGLIKPSGLTLKPWNYPFLELSRWPWLLYAFFKGVVIASFKHRQFFRVTPKKDKARFDTKLLYPYLILAMGGWLSMAAYYLMYEEIPQLHQVMWVVIVSYIYSVLIMFITVMDVMRLKNDGNSLVQVSQSLGSPIFITLCTVLFNAYLPYFIYFNG